MTITSKETAKAEDLPNLLGYVAFDHDTEGFNRSQRGDMARSTVTVVSSAAARAKCHL